MYATFEYLELKERLIKNVDYGGIIIDNKNRNFEDNDNINNNINEIKYNMMELILNGIKRSYRLKIPMIYKCILAQAIKACLDYKLDIAVIMKEYKIINEYSLPLSSIEIEVDQTIFNKRISRLINYYNKRVYLNSYVLNGKSIGVKKKGLLWLDASYGKGMG